MDKKIKFTPEQLNKLQAFFRQSDFTANMTLNREYDFTSEQSEIFVRAKKIFGDYWLGNLRPLGVNRKMKNFSKDYPVNFLENADADYFSEQISEIYTDPDKLIEYIDRFFEMYGEPVMLGIDCYAKSVGKEADDLTDEEIHTVVEKVAGVIDETLIETVMQGQQVSEILGISKKIPQHEDFSEQLHQDKINFYNKWTHCKTKLGAPLFFSELSEDEFKNKIGDHLELRKVSDEVCREHGLSVLENSSFYSKGQKKEYWAHRNEQMTHRDMLKKDIDYCLQYSSNGSEFERQLWGLGYSIDWRRLSIKHKGWDRAVRLKSIGITEATLEECFSKNKGKYYFYDEWNTHLPYKAKRTPIIRLMNQLDFTVDHAKDPSKVLVSEVIYIILSLFEIARTVKDFVIADVELRHEVRNVKKYVSEYRFLQAEKLNTMTDIKNYIDTTKAEINKFERSRALTDNKRRRAKTPEEKQQHKDERKVITERIAPLRQKLKQAEQIYNKSPRLIDLLDREYQIERKTYERTK